MEFLEKLTDKVGKATQTVSKKSSQFIEVARLNLSISTEEEKIRSLYMNIGKKIYKNYCSEIELPDEIASDCESISIHKKNIRTLKQKILEIKNIKICTNCGAELDIHYNFCSGCGFEQPAEFTLKTRPRPDLCQSCGELLEPGSSFCTSCGANITG